MPFASLLRHRRSMGLFVGVVQAVVVSSAFGSDLTVANWDLITAGNNVTPGYNWLGDPVSNWFDQGPLTLSSSGSGGPLYVAMPNSADDVAENARIAWLSPVTPESDDSGNLLGRTLTATFEFTASNRTTGDAIDPADFTGDKYGYYAEGTPDEARINFRMYSATAPSGQNYFFTQSEEIPLANMKWNTPITMSADMVPAQWSNVSGGSTDPTDFDLTASNVTQLGLWFGSGYTVYNGLAYRAGTDAPLGSFELTNFTTLSDAVPEPASLSLLGVGAIGLVRRRRRQFA